MHSKLLKKKTSLVSKALFGALLVTTFFAPLQGLFVSQAKAQSVVNARATSDANNPNISPTASGATASGQGGTAGPSGAGQTAVECSWSPSNWGICFTNVVYVFTVGLMSVFAYIGAFIFDTAIQITLQSVTYSQYFLTQSWAAVRDLANMIFIFLLVYLAVTVILQAETQGTMKMLAGIIIAALLINFSFFFTRLVIDGGNILATQFYNAIPAPTLNSSGATGTGTVGAVQSAASSLSSNGNVKDLTRGIMDVVGVQSILGSGSFARFSQQGANEFTKIITLVFVYIAVAIILAMLAFTFIAVGVKFLVRIVVLWLAIIASPLAFVFGAMYKKGSADRFNVLSRWGKALIEYAFYPAVFLFIFWIINFFATQLAGNGTSSILANALNDAGSAATNGQLFTIASAVAGVSVRLGIIVALMYMAMRVSDSFAKTGYQAADKTIGLIGNKATTFIGRTVGNATYGAVGLAGRNTIGLAGRTIAASTTRGTGVLSKTANRAGGWVGNRSFDARTSVVRKNLQTISKLDIGPQKTGWKLPGILISRQNNPNPPQPQSNPQNPPQQGPQNPAPQTPPQNPQGPNPQNLPQPQSNEPGQTLSSGRLDVPSGVPERSTRRLNSPSVINEMNSNLEEFRRDGGVLGQESQNYSSNNTSSAAETRGTESGSQAPVPGGAASQNLQQPSLQGSHTGSGGPRQQQAGGARPYQPTNNLNDPLGLRQQRALHELRNTDVLGDSLGVRERGPIPTGSAPASRTAVGVSNRELNTALTEQTTRVTDAIENLQSTVETQQRGATRATNELQSGMRNVADELRQLRRTTVEGTASLRESLVQPTISLNEQLNNTLSSAQRNAIQPPAQTQPIRAIPRVETTPPGNSSNSTLNTIVQSGQNTAPPSTPLENNQHN